MKALRRFISCYSDVVIIASFMFCCFAYIMFVIGIAPIQGSDLPAHALGAQQMLKENRLFDNNFLMYFMANLLTLFSGNLFYIELVLVFLIAVSNTAKYVIVRNEFAKIVSIGQARLVSLALLFVFVIPVLYFMKIFGVFLNTNNMYLGYCVPNVWHNSTILCMMPFAIITYFLSVRQFEEYDSKRNRSITLFVALGALVKPSFFFTFGVAYPICMLIRYRFRKEFFCSFLPVVVGCLCVIYEFLTIYDGGDGSGVVVSILPLFTLAFWKSRILYFIISMALPVLFVLFYGKGIYRDLEFWFVLIMLIVALGISWCCQETGERAGHGNFGWQVISAMWFVYYYMAKKSMKITSSFAKKGSDKFIIRRAGGKNMLFLALYIVHVVMGVLYLAKYLITNSYA